MKFEEVLPALREGKRAKIVGSEGVYFLDDKQELIVYKKDGWRVGTSIDYGKITSDDWEIVEEKKKVKVKLRDLTPEQYKSWCEKNCDKYERCEDCIFFKVHCIEDISNCWIENKDLYSDKFLDQEIEIEE